MNLQPSDETRRADASEATALSEEASPQSCTLSRTGLEGHAASARAVHEALLGVPSLGTRSEERDRLWLVVYDEVCTREHTRAWALGSSWEGDIGGEDCRHAELLAAMCWLMDHEREARGMAPGQLMRRLRGVAVRGKHGSVRLTQADALHGMTHVSEDARLSFTYEWVA